MIKELKQHPSLYNEIRTEIETPRLLREGEANKNNYTADPFEDNLLAVVDEEELIKSIVINLNYFIEYEREMREGDL